jgi:hypothetical protein
MATMIQLTSISESAHPIYVNADHIRWVVKLPRAANTTIVFTGEDKSATLTVREEPHEIAGMIEARRA